MSKNIEITEDIIQEVNRLLKEDELSLDEDGSILDYRGVDIQIHESCVTHRPLYDGSGCMRIRSVEFSVGNALYKYAFAENIHGSEVSLVFLEDCGAALSLDDTGYLLFRDRSADRWLVRWTLEGADRLDFDEQVEEAIHKGINGNLKMPYFKI